MQKSVKLLMVEDSSALTELYLSYLENNAFLISSVNTLSLAREAYKTDRHDIVLLDIELPDGNGMDLLAEIMQYPEHERAEVIVMTAHERGSMAAEAIAMGALDFLTKPFDANRLRVTLHNARSRISLAHRAMQLNQLERVTFGNFIGSSLAMQAVYKTIDSLAATKASAFIVGESGTGKELASEAIHQYSPRSENEFVAINCGAIPSELMESELFGHTKGAFTGASSTREGAARQANGGTLFLDEICEMDLVLQKKFLRFIQTGTFRKVGSDKLEQVDVRFVCATNRDPLVEVKQGRFREDLFYRLHVVPLRLPPLREREHDILLIARSFLEKYSKRDGKAFQGFVKKTEEALLRYPWPGNVRQLQNVVQQIVVLYDGKWVEPKMLPDYVIEGHLDDNESVSKSIIQTPQTIHSHMKVRMSVKPLWIVEKETIESAIELCKGNVNKAAGLLEVAPSTLYRKMQSWKKLN